jgi:hypothetical protein
MPPSGESAVPSSADEAEIWVRGNPRPVAGLAVAGLMVAACLGGGVAAGGGSTWLAVAVALGLALVIAVLAIGALQPRLACRGTRLVVRLQPFNAREVPLEVVECVFPGSQSLPRTGSPPDAPSDRRVGTIVIRLAERATAWRQRSTLAPWGTWKDGHIIIDGRWCEPLSSDFTRSLGGRLVEAKRRAGVAHPGENPAGGCAEAAEEPSA